MCQYEQNLAERNNKQETYADVELDHAPQNQHSRVSIAVLDAIDLQIPEHGAEGREKSQQKDDDQTDLLGHADLELDQDWNRNDSNRHIRDYRDDGVCGEGWTRFEACTWRERVPRLVHWLARQNERQGASQVSHDDENDGSPYNPPVCDVVCALEQTKVADQQGDFEEADAQLVNRSSGVVASRVVDEVGCWPPLKRQSETILRFCLEVSARSLVELF